MYQEEVEAKSTKIEDLTLIQFPKTLIDLIAAEIIAKIEPNAEETQAQNNMLTRAQYEDLFVKMVELARDENCPIINLQTIAEILTADPLTIKSMDHVSKIIELLKSLDAVDFMQLNTALIPQYIKHVLENGDQDATNFQNWNLVVLTLQSDAEMNLSELKQLSKTHNFSPILIKKDNQIYIYGAEKNQWKITKFNRKISKRLDLEFPKPLEKPIVLKHSEIPKEMLLEISLLNGHHPVIDYRIMLIKELMKQQNIIDESESYIRPILFSRFDELVKKVMKRFLFANIKRQKYDIYTDTDMLEWMVESANSYIVMLRAIHNAISEVPPNIRANCYLALESILKNLFPDNQPSKNPFYNNQTKSPFTKKIEIPQAAFGIFLLYINRRFLGLFLNEKINHLAKEGFDSCFTDAELRTGIALLKLNKIFNKRKSPFTLQSIETNDQELITILNSNEELKNFLIEKTSIALSKDLDLINNPFVLYIQLQRFSKQDSLDDLIESIRIAINATFSTSINILVKDFKRQENIFDPAVASPERQLAEAIYSRSFRDFSRSYLQILAKLAKKSPAKLAFAIEAKQHASKEEQIDDDNSSDADQKAPTSDSTVSVLEQQPIQSLHDTKALDPIWNTFRARLLQCDTLDELESIIQDAWNKLYAPKKVANPTKIIKSYEEKNLLLTLFLPPKVLLKKKSTFNLHSYRSTVNIAEELELLSQDPQSLQTRDALGDLFARNPAKFTSFFVDKLTECMNDFIKKSGYLIETFAPFLQFAQACLTENDAKNLRQALEGAIASHTLQKDFKDLLKSKEYLNLDEPIFHFPEDESELYSQHKCTIA